MFTFVRNVLSLCVVSLLFACTPELLVKQLPEWGYEKNAIKLHLVSDPQLNLYQKKDHSLIFCLYHLRDLNGFNQLVDEQGGLLSLLECKRFDQSVTYVRKFVVQPNQDLTEVLDRTDGAKYVGVVAGYYTQQKESSVRSFKIPISEIKKGSTIIQKPEQLNIDLYLGALGFATSKIITTVDITKEGKGKK